MKAKMKVKMKMKSGNAGKSPVQSSDPARMGHHKLSSHEAHMLHDGRDDNEGGEVDGFGKGMDAPVGPRQSAKSHRGY